MFGRARILLTMAASALATPVAAQAPAPTTTAFDGRYVGSATKTGGGRLLCGAIVSEEMMITRGEVIIHEVRLQEGEPIFRGSINTAGEVSASHYFMGKGQFVGIHYDIISGTVHDNVFEGQRRLEYLCYDSLRMQKVASLGPTMPFDGDYIGVSRESSGSSPQCPGNGVPSSLIVRNSFVLGYWEGTVSPQGALVIQTRKSTRIEGQIDNQGIIRARGNSSDGGCTVTFVWRKQTG